MVPVRFSVPAVPALARVKVPNWALLKVPSRFSVPPLAVMSMVPGGAVAPSLLQAPVRERMPPSTRTVPWFSKPPATVRVLPAVLATKVPWLTIEEPVTAALTLAVPVLETVTPAPMVSTPLVAISRRLALLPAPASTTEPAPERVWVPLNSRLEKAPLVELTVRVRPAAMPRPLVTVRR